MDLSHILLLICSVAVISCQTIAIPSLMRPYLLSKKAQIEALPNNSDSPDVIPMVTKLIMKKGTIPDIKRVPDELLKAKPVTISRRAVIEKQVPIFRKEMPELLMPRNVAEQTVPKLIQNEVVMPNTVINAKPSKVIVQKPDELILPKKVIVQNAKNVAKPVQFIVKKPELANKVLLNSGVEKPNRKILIQKFKEIPMIKNLASNIKGKVIVLADNIPKKAKSRSDTILNPKPLIIKARLAETVAPNIAVDPTMLAVSPLSSLSSSKSLIPQSKGQFLRKIPIPPPTL